MFAARARMHHPDALRGPKAAILRSSPIVVEVRNKNGGIVDLGGAVRAQQKTLESRAMGHQHASLESATVCQGSYRAPWWFS